MLLFERIVGRHVMDRAKPFDQARAAALQANEDESAPFLGVDGVGGSRRRIEMRVAAEIGRLVEPPVALVAPAMIGADDQLAAMAGACGQELQRRDGGRHCGRRALPVVVAHGENRIAGDSSRRHSRPDRGAARTTKTASSSWRRSRAARARKCGIAIVRWPAAVQSNSAVVRHRRRTPEQHQVR